MNNEKRQGMNELEQNKGSSSENDRNFFTKNVLILSLGPVISALVSFLAEPFIARFFAPEVFGPGMVFTSLVLILSPLMFLRYNGAIVQAINKKEASDLTGLSLMIYVIMICGTSIILIAFPSLSLRLFNFDLFEYFTYFLLSLSFFAISFLLRTWYSYRKVFYMLTINVLVLQVGAVIFLLIAGGMGYRDTESYILARTLAFVLSTGIILLFFLKNDLGVIIKNLSIKGIRRAARNYRNFPLFEFWSTIARLVFLQVPIFLISKFWGPHETGLYAKAFAILSLAGITITNSVNTVYYREIAGRIQNNTPIEQFTYTLIKSIIKMIIVPLLVVLFIGSELFGVFLGQRWEDAGRIGAILVPWLFFSIVSGSIRPLYNLYNKQRIYVVIAYSVLFCSVLIFYLSNKYDLSLYLTLGIFSCVAAVSNFLEIGIILKLASLDHKVLLKYVFKKIIEIIPFAAVNAFLILFKIENEYILIGVNVFMAGIYVYYYIFRDPFIRDVILNLGGGKANFIKGKN